MSSSFPPVQDRAPTRTRHPRVPSRSNGKRNDAAGGTYRKLAAATSTISTIISTVFQLDDKKTLTGAEYDNHTHKVPAWIEAARVSAADRDVPVIRQDDHPRLLRLSQRRFRLEPLNPGWRHAPPSATRTPMTNLFLGLRKDSEEIVGLIGNNSFNTSTYPSDYSASPSPPHLVLLHAPPARARAQAHKSNPPLRRRVPARERPRRHRGPRRPSMVTSFGIMYAYADVQERRMLTKYSRDDDDYSKLFSLVLTCSGSNTSSRTTTWSRETPGWLRIDVFGATISAPTSSPITASSKRDISSTALVAHSAGLA
ncbi:hypothetical protein C8F01DRAFT_1261861 [Mycena amicta]|nr:hypothetical protein C8F01DRAFT_1261861 [Mycena amicta]